MADYTFVTRWHIGAPIERVFAEIEDSPSWPSWWKGVVAVDLLEPGRDDSVGQVTRTTWRSRLPYDLTFHARVARKRAPVEIVVDAFGELEGKGRWELAPEGDGTAVTYHWNVATNKWWMNALAPIARPLFQWNHDAIMRWGGEGLAKRLGASYTER